MMGIGPPPEPKSVPYTQEEFYCERCDKSYEDETVYSTLNGLFMCKKCNKEIEKKR